jgi:hypothetical protein
VAPIALPVELAPALVATRPLFSPTVPRKKSTLSRIARLRCRLFTNLREIILPDQPSDFIPRWESSAAAERANYQLFLSELCDFLGVPRPNPTVPDDEQNIYVFERRFNSAMLTVRRRLDALTYIRNPVLFWKPSRAAIKPLNQSL